MTQNQIVGITVMPEYIQSETINGVLDNLQNKARVTAVSISPYVMGEIDKDKGSRAPPIDAGAGTVRLLDRSLWGKRELWVQTAPSFQPDLNFYQGLHYQPPPVTNLTEKSGHLVQGFIRAAQDRGLKVYMQIQAAIPPGYRVQFGQPDPDDCPCLPDGQIPKKRLSANGSLASPHIIKYTQALIRDLCSQYPSLQGIRFDWPEYPPYLLDCAFVDFSKHAMKAANRLGFNFNRMKKAAIRLYQELHGNLKDSDLIAWNESNKGFNYIQGLRQENSGLGEWVRFKAKLVEELHSVFRQTMNQAGANKMELLSNAFPPPWTIFSGMDYECVGRYSSAICVKLYTMHWPMMLQFYGQQLLKANHQLSEKLLVTTLNNGLDITDNKSLNQLENFHYPTPKEAHLAGKQSQHRKIILAQKEAGKTPVYAVVHAYGPLEDFRQRLQIAQAASSHGIWINRYGHLSDKKLEIIGELDHRQD